MRPISSTPPAPAPDAPDTPAAPNAPDAPGAVGAPDGADAPVVHGTVDTRTGGPMLGGEREQLDAWIAEYRLALLLKIDGLTPA
ncbi:hypothetical protein [Brachybacterium sp. J153]|uniref:hypothetical protein n=1 Tax=Brachybacterium sp. J153 TaxID=3116488 RepID=UPI002E79CF15|nr:hypothetical protein [Brachybacterium sp. J153]MEE1619369.1 hypothetical protein [Brachybacterium sp. J153]